MLADDEFLVGCYLNESLRNDRVEAAAAGVIVEHAHDSKMIALAAADALIGAHCTGINLGSAYLAGCEKILLLLGSGLDDGGKFLLLRLKILVPYGNVILESLKFLLLHENGFLGVSHILLGNLPEELMVLDLL